VDPATVNEGGAITQVTGAVRPDGVMVVAWQEQTGSSYTLRVARRMRSGIMTPPDTLDTQGVPFTGLAVAADSLSNAIVTWCAGPLCTHLSHVSTLKYARLDPAGGRDAPVTITDNGFEPSLAIDGGGRAYVAYATDGGGVHVASLSSTVSSTPEIVDVAQTNVANPDPVIAIGEGNSPTLLFHDAAADAAGASNLLRSLRLAPGATWADGTAQILDAEPSGIAINDVRLTTDRVGRAFAAWVADGGTFTPGVPPTTTSSSTLKTAFAGAEGAAFGPTTSGRTAESGAISAPAVAIDTSGEPRIAYTRTNPDGGSTLLSGRAAGSDSQFGTSATSGGAPSLAALGDGSVMLAVRHDDHIQAVRITDDTAGGLTTLETATVLSDPLALTAPGNDAAVLWLAGPSSSAQSVRVAGYDATAPTARLVLPGKAVAGKPATLTVDWADMWSEPRFVWTFGDGESGAGAETVNHVFAAAGTYTVSVSVTDTRENGPVVTARPLTVDAAPPPPAKPPTTTPPATKPPATNPPADNPPSNNPPASNPPAGNPPSSNPPATKPSGATTPGTKGNGSTGNGGNGAGSGNGTSGSGTGAPRKAVAELFPIGRVVISGRTVKLAYAIICEEPGLPCTVNGIVRNGPRKLGKFKLTIRPGRTARVKFKLTKSGRRLLLERRRLRVRIAAKGVRGLPTSFVLRAPRPKRAHTAWA
jgi:hypothetical protein